MTSLSIGTNRTIGTSGPLELPCTQPDHMENNLSPLNRTTGMTSVSIGTNRTIGTNGPSVWRIVSVCVYWTCVECKIHCNTGKGQKNQANKKQKQHDRVNHNGMSQCELSVRRVP